MMLETCAITAISVVDSYFAPLVLRTGVFIMPKSFQRSLQVNGCE